MKLDHFWARPRLRVSKVIFLCIPGFQLTATTLICVGVGLFMFWIATVKLLLHTSYGLGSSTFLESGQKLGILQDWQSDLGSDWEDCWYVFLAYRNLGYPWLAL